MPCQKIQELDAMEAHRDAGNSQPDGNPPVGNSGPGILFWVLVLSGTAVTAIVWSVWLSLPIWTLLVFAPLALLRTLANDEMRKKALRRASYLLNQGGSGPHNGDHTTDATDDH